jgi:UDP-N-acetylglucosamine 2-epimerase (non-hydrolysing)
MSEAFAILTDSGGVQEEAPSLGTPELVIRETTERSEAVEAGAARVVGTEREAVVAAVDALLSAPPGSDRSAQPANPYGDGWASERIVRVLAERFGIAPAPWPNGVPVDWTA